MALKVRLTQNELEVLKAIDSSEYGDNLNDPVWSFTIADNSKLEKTSIPGICSSLSKKGLVSCTEYEENQNTIAITKKGIEAYVAAVGKENIKKTILG